ncbi:MAG: WecB/TagA/CpsF family glycosyltransferase [Spirochaetes bacterium]|nr:WecB/TagA/CpsF family glycosyltransferase [Spirochaetota bacterium]MBX3721822.1 WecB/TagA/CpsF family glycosyltransferase [Turneriella sp.]
MRNDFSLDPVLTNKDDSDPILEYKNIDTSLLAARRIYLGKIPFYQATSADLVAHSIHRLDKMREKKSKSSGQFGPQLVFPFDPYRYVWVRFRKRMLAMANEAFINLPDGSGMLYMARALRQPLPELISTVAYAMNLIRIAHAKEYTVFLLGSRDEVLEKLYTNFRRSFAGLRIVGRHNGYLKGPAASRVLEAVRKTDPHILFVGMGYHRGMRWIEENRSQLGDLIIVNVGGAFDTLAGTKKKAPMFMAAAGYTWLWRTINKPYRWHRLFLVLYWFFETMYYKFFKKK